MGILKKKMGRRIRIRRLVMRKRNKVKKEREKRNNSKIIRKNNVIS